MCRTGLLTTMGVFNEACAAASDGLDLGLGGTFVTRVLWNTAGEDPAGRGLSAGRYEGSRGSKKREENSSRVGVSSFKRVQRT